MPKPGVDREVRKPGSQAVFRTPIAASAYGWLGTVRRPGASTPTGVHSSLLPPQDMPGYCQALRLEELLPATQGTDLSPIK